MKAPRFSIFTLMAIVGVVALNLALGRVLWDGRSDDPLIEIGLNAVVAQLAVYFLIRSQNRARALWIGFVASSVVAALSCAYALRPGSESVLTAVLIEYLGRVEEFVGIAVLQSGFTIQTTPPDSYTLLIETAELALILFLPQLVAALSGGLVGFLLASLAHLFRRRPALQPAPG